MVTIPPAINDRLLVVARKLATTYGIPVAEVQTVLVDVVTIVCDYLDQEAGCDCEPVALDRNGGDQ